MDRLLRLDLEAILEEMRERREMSSLRGANYEEERAWARDIEARLTDLYVRASLVEHVGRLARMAS